MTEIKVQHKEHKRGARWPWLLLLLIPLAWFALRGRDDDRTEVDRAGAVDTTTYVAPANTGATTSTPAATGTTGNPR